MTAANTGAGPCTGDCRREVDGVAGATVLGPDDDYSVAMQLRWCSCDPWAVTAVIGDPSVDWVFGLELLAAGCDGPAGEGDVRVRPCPPSDPQLVDDETRTVSGELELELSTPTGYGVLRVAAPELEVFLDRVTRDRITDDDGAGGRELVVPTLDGWRDDEIDAALAELVEAGSRGECG